MMSEGISYQNKDLMFKILGDYYKHKTFKVYGLELPPIKEALDSSLPAVKINEKRTDSLFLLEDDSILILEYESSTSKANILKYGHYAFRVAEKYFADGVGKITVAVIYTGDVTDAANKLDLGCLKIDIQQVFLSKFNTEKIFSEIKCKVENNLPLTEEDVMRFIVLPLTQKNDKQKLIEDTVELAKFVQDENQLCFIVAGILVVSDKFIDQNYSKKMKEWISMTKVGRLYEEEKIDAVNSALLGRMKETAKIMILEGCDNALILKATSLVREDVEKLREEVRLALKAQ